MCKIQLGNPMRPGIAPLVSAMLAAHDTAAHSGVARTLAEIGQPSAEGLGT